MLSPAWCALASLVGPGKRGETAWWASVVTGVLGFVTLADDWSRRVFLGWIFTTNEPLAQRLRSLLTEEDAAALREAGVPIYATLSWYHAHGGRVPRYVRIDQLGREEIPDTLLQSASFPGVFPTPRFQGQHAADGGWTDNTPRPAPLLFDPALDLDTLFVIKVDKAVAHVPRRSGWPRRYSGRPGRDEKLGPAAFDWDLTKHSTTHWKAHLRHNLEAPESVIRRQVPAVPRIITTMPSDALGDLYTGTFWFSRKKAKRLVNWRRRHAGGARERESSGGAGARRERLFPACWSRLPSKRRDTPPAACGPSPATTFFGELFQILRACRGCGINHGSHPDADRRATEFLPETRCLFLSPRRHYRKRRSAGTHGQGGDAVLSFQQPSCGTDGAFRSDHQEPPPHAARQPPGPALPVRFAARHIDPLPELRDVPLQQRKLLHVLRDEENYGAPQYGHHRHGSVEQTSHANYYFSVDDSKFSYKILI